MGKKIIIFFTLCFILVQSNAQVKLSSADLIKIDEATLAQKKLAIKNKDTFLLPAYNALIEVANKLLDYAPVSVMEKKATPPSGDKHDYMSLAPYWWPNPATPNGLPYVRRDGEVNPEVKDYPDKNNMPKVCENIYFLGLAYYYSNNKKYAKHAAKLLQVWFLNKKTKMNPNLNFGQIVKGQNDGRGAGIIDTRHFIYALDAVSLIKSSKCWTTKNNSDLQKWFNEYLVWLNTSTNGIDELNAKNNHGVFYDAQALAFANFINDKTQALQIIERATKRLDTQMNVDGLFPLELERTTSLHYSVFILNAFFAIANEAQKVNIDFWNKTTVTNKSLTKGFDALQPYITKQKTWTMQQIKPFNFTDAYPLLIFGKTKLNCTNCYDALNKMADRGNILYRLL
jgi:hypothetical protein